MAVYEESEVFQMNPVASVSTNDVMNLEGEELRKYVFQVINNISIPPTYQVTEQDVGTLIRHHCSFRKLKKAALLALPYVLKANLITAPWRNRVKDGKLKKGKDKKPSGMISAPILIDGVKYLCNITNKLQKSGISVPYALTLKDGNGNIIEGEKMDNPSNVPHSNSEYSTSGNTHFDKAATSHGLNPSSNIVNNPNQERFNDYRETNGLKDSKIPRYNIIKEYNNQNNCNRNMKNKKVVRLTESQLHNIIAESVKRIINEGGDHMFSVPETDKNTNSNEFSDSFRDSNSDNPFGLVSARNGSPHTDDDFQEFSFDPETMTLSCQGRSMKVSPTSNFMDVMARFTDLMRFGGWDNRKDRSFYISRKSYHQ